MSIWAIIHFLFSIGFIVVPLILCYKKFSKAVKGSYINAFNVFVIIYTCPSYTGGAVVSISSFADIQLLLGIIGGIIGLGELLSIMLCLNARTGPKKATMISPLTMPLESLGDMRFSTLLFLGL